jgi:hypothetical protein
VPCQNQEHVCACGGGGKALVKGRDVDRRDHIHISNIDYLTAHAALFASLVLLTARKKAKNVVLVAGI